MSYEIFNHWQCIKFVNNGVECLISKSEIKNMSVIRQDTVQISIGNCMGNISINIKDVIYPESISADMLVGYLNEWMTNTLLPPIGGG